MRIVNLAGKRFGKLTAIKRSGTDGSNAWWECVCECGKEKTVRLCHLQSGSVKSCGCGPKGRGRHEHGMTGTRIYRIYRQMLYRCSGKKAPEYKNYGRRGIKVCGRWSDFNNFYADMGDPPSDKHSIERLDVNGNYEKYKKTGELQCVWATSKEQHQNRRDNHNITAFGKTQCLTAWAEEYKIPPSTLKNRIYRSKMRPEDALTASLYAQQRNSA